MHNNHRKKYSYNSSKKTLYTQFQSGTIALMVIITIIFIVLSLFALFYHNKNATNGYKLKILREKREKLMFDIEILDRQIADLSAINSEDKNKKMNLDTISTPTFRTKIIYLKGKK